jgi:hypothetical protein
MDDIFVEVKFNFGEKIKGAFAEEDADLEHLEDNLLQKITKKVLWTVVQSKYDPLGLLSAYMIKRKMLM